MSFARWAPDSRRLLTTCEFNLRITIWSLIDRSTAYINYPKYAEKGVAFTSNGYFMALAERKESKDFIGIYYVGDWTLVSHFQVDSYDLQDLCWSKDNTAIIVWDSVLECRFFVYSPTGNLIATHEPYQLNLGIKSLNFSPNGHYLTVGFYDQTVRIYNHITWKMIIDFAHTPSISDSSNINIFREEEVDEVSYSGENKKTTKYVDIKAPVKFNTLKVSLDKPNPPIGISEMCWSYDSNFLATKNDNMPNVLWVWQVSSLSLHTLIIQIKPIKHFSWSPTEHILLISTENSKLYSFTLTNVYVVELVTDTNYVLNIGKIDWNVDGKCFVVSDKNNMIIGHPEINEDQDDNMGDNHGTEVYDQSNQSHLTHQSHHTNQSHYNEEVENTGNYGGRSYSEDN